MAPKKGKNKNFLYKLQNLSAGWVEVPLPIFTRLFSHTSFWNFRTDHYKSLSW